MNDDNTLIGDTEIERLRAIFDRGRRLETDEDLLEVAEYVEDESVEIGADADRDRDVGDRG